MNRVILSVLVLSGLGFGSVSKKEAEEFTRGMVTISNVEQPDLADRFLFNQCAEIASCAGKCKDTLEAMTLIPREEDKRTLLAECFPDYRKACEKAKGQCASSSAFIRDHSRKFAAKVRPKLNKAQAKNLDEALARLKP